MAGNGWYSAYPRLSSEVKLGPPFLTKYERARLIGIRALQLSFGAPPLVAPELVGSRDPIAIATYEVDHALLPVTIIRYRRSGEGYPDEVVDVIPLKRLLEVEKRVVGGRVFR
ncbi:DNA-directed RNA polymerase subunit K [Stetteria hydrogenophila]